MLRRAPRLAIPALAAVSLGLAACSTPPSSGHGASASGAGAGTARSGGTLTVGLAEAPDALDPTTAQTYVGRVVMINMFEKLYDINAQAQIVPELASQMPQISGGGKTWVIHLRSGIKFNDGTPFNAAAVKATLERDMTDKLSARAASLSAITSVTAVNPTTVKLTLSKPDSPLLAVLAARSGMIESPKAIKALGNNFSKHPVGVGPFEFASRPSSDEIVLQKSPYYYGKSAVKLSKIVFQVITQPQVRATDLQAGSIDVADRIQPSDYASLKKDSAVRLDPVTTLGYEGITINVSNSHGAGQPPFTTASNVLAQHPELREAFKLALNRQVINKVVFGGLYVPGCTPISPASPWYQNLPCSSQDISKAKQLVAASGVRTPITVPLMIEAGNDLETKLASVIQSMESPAGFKVSIQPTEFTTALQEAQHGKFTAFQIGWSGRLDPDQNIAPFWGPGSLLNYSGANYSSIDSLLAQARAAQTMAARKALYKQAIQQMQQENNIIYLYYPKFILGYRANVTGIGYYADGLMRFASAGFTSGS